LNLLMYRFFGQPLRPFRTSRNGPVT